MEPRKHGVYGKVAHPKTAAKMAGAARARCPQGGFQLVELTVTVAILGIVLAITWPPLTVWWRGLMVELAADELAGAMQMARWYAVRHQANVGVKFALGEDGEIHHVLYRDDDGDGVRSGDIAAGIDPLLRAPQRAGAYGGVSFGFPPGLEPRSPSGRRLGRLDDPVRFNRSDLASFSSHGTATPGTLYLTDGRHHLLAVTVNRAGRVRVLRYDAERERWW